MFNRTAARTNVCRAKKIGAKAPIYAIYWIHLGPRLRGDDGGLLNQFFSNFFIQADSWCGRRPS